MKNKENGSALLTVLIISMALSIIGAVTTSAIVNTTKGNAIGRNKEDLFYSAESGIELGIALVKTDVRYLDSKYNVLIKGQIDEKSDRLISQGINSVHSVDISIDSEVNTKAKIKSIAYGYDENGDKDINNKRVVEKTISRKNNKNLLAEDLLKNSIVAEDKININAATINMETTQIASGGGPPTLNKLGDMKDPIILDEKYSTPIFKSSGNVRLKGGGDTRNLPNIRKQSVVKMDRFAGNISNNSLFVNATILKDDGTTIAENGIGKIYSLEDDLGEWATYNVIVVNADKLIIEPPTFGLNENKTIIICSGDIEVRLGGTLADGTEITQGANITDSTLFGRNVTMIGGASVTVARSPRMGDVNDQLSEKQLKKINEVLSMYIDNWGTNEDVSDVSESDDWEVIDSESIYE